MGDPTSSSSRAQTHANRQDSTVKSVRYEDAQGGIPPLPVASLNASARNLSLAEDPKRDSAIAPSVSTPERFSYAESQVSSIGGAAREPNLPTIVVQDDDAAVVMPTPTPTLTPTLTPTPQPSTSPAPQSVQVTSSLPSNPPEKPNHTSSSTELGTAIPSISTWNDLKFEDLGTDKIEFSNRGSMILAGKSMSDAIKQQQGTLTNGAIPDLGSVLDGTAQGAEAVPTSGPVGGSRTQSVQRLQAAITGGRVLSADEMTFSLKVRNMYDHGDEDATKWTAAGQEASSIKDSDDHEASSSVLASPVTSVATHRLSSAMDDSASLQPSRSSRYHRLSVVKEPTELAGGIEDWDEVSGADVDRYGFIRPKQAESPTPKRFQGGQRDGLQRVATSLRLEADQPRRSRAPRRMLSRSSRSVPPSQSDEGVTGRTAGSVRSYSSSMTTRSSSRAFRSRDKRVLDEAGDMLTLPPGLADIAEQEDAGRTASFLKRREWSREEKWQKMARPVRGQAKARGGGMDFEFDPNDGKIISRTWKGIPDRWRATVWHSFLTASARKRGLHAPDEELVEQFHGLQEMSCADDVQIDVDVPRTINMHIMFRRRYRGGQRLLFRVLHAVSLYFPTVGYVQGMASLAATLLCYYDEERAFVMMVRLWQLRGLEQLFQDGFTGLMTALDEFEREWLGKGEVARKLQDLGVTSTAYGTRWYLTLFNMSLPFPAQLRVWDVFMLLGDASGAPSEQQTNAFGGADLDVLHATSAALIDATREIVLDSDFENVMKVLTSFVPIKDEDLLMRVARTEWKMKKKRAGGKA